MIILLIYNIKNSVQSFCSINCTICCSAINIATSSAQQLLKAQTISVSSELGIFTTVYPVSLLLPKHAVNQTFKATGCYQKSAARPALAKYYKVIPVTLLF